MPRSPTRYDKERRDRDRDRYGSKKDHSSEVARMKEKMRNNLEIASKSSNFAPKKSYEPENLTAAEHMARTKAIEQIEEGGFQVGSFRSGSGSGTVKKDQKSKKETSHDAAIFGPAWKSAEQRKIIEKKESDVSSISMPIGAPPPLNTMAPMVPSHMMSEHSSKRKEDWKAYWSTLRQELIAENH